MTAYLIAAFGLAYIVGHSTISLPVRVWLGGSPAKPDLNLTAVPGALGPLGDWLVTLLECPACFGFWTGIAASFLGVAFPELVTHRLVAPLALGCLTSGSNFIVGRLTKLI